MELVSISAMPNIVDFDTNVSIFRNTRAVDIADKINAIGEAIKAHNNDEIIAKVNTYVNGELQPKLQTIADTLETTINQHETDTSDLITNLFDAFEDSVTTNLNAYTIATAAYTIEQSNSLSFTGNTGNVVRDENDNLKVWTVGNTTYEVLSVNDKGSILTASETITVVKNYTFTYLADDITLESITEV